GDGLVLLLAGERLPREVVVAGAHRDHRLAFPLLGLVRFGRVLLLQLLLVGDRAGHSLLRLDQLLLHLEQHLGQHFLGILGLRDEVVDVGLDQRPESGKDPHGFHRAYGIKGVVATLAPSVLLPVLRESNRRRRCPPTSHAGTRATSASSWTATAAGRSGRAARVSRDIALAPIPYATSRAHPARSGSRRSRC